MIADDPVRSFRATIAPPSAAGRDSARARLLSAIATADSAPPRRRARWYRPRLAIVVALATAAAVSLAALALDAGGGGVTERAEAALSGPTRILHVVATITDRNGTERQEAWVRTDGSRGRTVSLSGAPRSDCVGTRTQLRCYDTRRNVVDVYTYYPDAVRAGEARATPGYRADDPASLAAALASGHARAVGETTFAGRPAHAIQLAVQSLAADGGATPTFSDDSPILYVDAGTYLPVGQRFPDAGSTTRYETYEFLPDTAANARLLELGAPAGARVVTHAVGEGPG